VYDENYKVYGARKIWWELHREGTRVGRCRVERLMRRLGLSGAVRGKTVRTTKDGVQAADLVKRQFTAGAPEPLVGGGLHLCRYVGGHRVRRVRQSPSRFLCKPEVICLHL
jgi:putative transposase